MEMQGKKTGFEISIRWGNLPPLKIALAVFGEADASNEPLAASVGRCEHTRVDNVSFSTLARAGSVPEGVSPNPDYCSGANFAAHTNVAVMENRGEERERRNLFDEGIENIMSYQAGVSQTDMEQEDDE